MKPHFLIAAAIISLSMMSGCSRISHMMDGDEPENTAYDDRMKAAHTQTAENTEGNQEGLEGNQELALSEGKKPDFGPDFGNVGTL